MFDSESRTRSPELPLPTQSESLPVLYLQAARERVVRDAQCTLGGWGVVAWSLKGVLKGVPYLEDRGAHSPFSGFGLKTTPTCDSWWVNLKAIILAPLLPRKA